MMKLDPVVVESVMVAAAGAIIEVIRRLRKENTLQHANNKAVIVALQEDHLEVKADVREVKADVRDVKADVREIRDMVVEGRS